MGAELLYDCDVIVVGGGAGGATFAYACARAGKSVLVLERGDRQTAGGPSFDEQAVLIDKGPYDDREVERCCPPRCGRSCGSGCSRWRGSSRTCRTPPT